MTAWATNLEGVDRDQLLRAVIEAIRTLILPDWEVKRPDDRRPQDALAATEAWLASRSPETVEQAKTAAKACTAARNDTYGYDHRIADAARGMAWAVTAKDNEPIWDALAAIEEELLARVALVGEYHRVPEQRKVISLIHQLKAQGRGVIFISHNLQDIFAVSDRIIVLRRGVKAGERKISETTHDEVVKLMVGG